MDQVDKESSIVALLLDSSKVITEEVEKFGSWLSLESRMVNDLNEVPPLFSRRRLDTIAMLFAYARKTCFRLVDCSLDSCFGFIDSLLYWI